MEALGGGSASASASVRAASVCPLDCPDACSLEVEVRDGQAVSVGGSRVNPLTADFICAKVRRLPEHVHGAARVRYPGLREGAKGEGRFRRASWDEALSLVARRMTELAATGEAEAILPVSYGGSNGYLSQDTSDARLFSRLGASRLARTVCSAPSGRSPWPGGRRCRSRPLPGRGCRPLPESTRRRCRGRAPEPCRAGSRFRSRSFPTSCRRRSR